MGKAKKNLYLNKINKNLKKKQKSQYSKVLFNLKKGFYWFKAWIPSLLSHPESIVLKSQEIPLYYTFLKYSFNQQSLLFLTFGTYSCIYTTNIYMYTYPLYIEWWLIVLNTIYLYMIFIGIQTHTHLVPILSLIPPFLTPFLPICLYIYVCIYRYRYNKVNIYIYMISKHKIVKRVSCSIS